MLASIIYKLVQVIHHERYMTTVAAKKSRPDTGILRWVVPHVIRRWQGFAPCCQYAVVLKTGLDVPHAVAPENLDRLCPSRTRRMPVLLTRTVYRATSVRATIRAIFWLGSIGSSVLLFCCGIVGRYKSCRVNTY